MPKPNQSMKTLETGAAQSRSNSGPRIVRFKVRSDRFGPYPYSNISENQETGAAHSRRSRGPERRVSELARSVSGPTLAQAHPKRENTENSHSAVLQR